MELNIIKCPVCLYIVIVYMVHVCVCVCANKETMILFLKMLNQQRLTESDEGGGARWLPL